MAMRRARGRRWRRRAGGRLRRRLGRVTTQDVIRALWLGALIGVVTGFVAILFFEALEFATQHLLADLTGYHPPHPLGEGGQEASDPTRRWALPIVVGLGALVSGLLVYSLAPEAEGAGADQVIDAFHKRGGRIRLRAIPVKLVASAITIGSGGAAGREGPAAQISGGIGSVIADRLGLDAVERRRALVAGMGAGVGAIFRAPLGGAMMAAEALYRDDFEADAILLSLISSIVAFAVYGAWYDYTPIFGGTAGFSFQNPEELPYYLALGVACGLLGILYARGFEGAQELFNRLTAPRWVKPAIGGVLVGCIGMFAPEAIHIGYGWVQRSITPEDVMDFSLWLIIALPLLRILAASLTVGSGASGGIFAPGMVAGGMLGALFWRLFHDLPGFPADPAPLVIIGMIAVFGSIAHAPLAMMLMVGEMTGNLSLLAPAMVAVAVATLLVGNTSIYRSQVPTRADSMAHRHRFAFPLLDALPAQRAVVPLAMVRDTATVADALASLERRRSTDGVVIDEGGRLVGEITSEELRAVPDAGSPVEGFAADLPAVVLADTPLDEALDRLASHDRRWLPVLDGSDGPVLGAIDARALVRSFREAARQQVRPLTPVDEQISTMELTVAVGAPVEGKRLAEAGLPAGVRVLTMEHMGRLSAPSGDTVLRRGDRLTLAMTRGTRGEVLALILGD
ncbi:MAG: CBS domain-containing protein [Dehalococcoidia bacterium]|nr:CBS domain-containing protein [Dehalococcoidia bacterium]MYD27339.1 CBS domain-containing protein [Dehalococcoidia bacterium]